MTAIRLCAVSVDLDGISAYRGLHGLVARDTGRHAVMDVALGRALSFARAERLPLTLFAIGNDLERERSADALRDAARSGARVENHSWSHPYDLSRQSAANVVSEIERCSDIVERVTGRRPHGFRAPGYVMSPTVFDAVREAGLTYDASPLPCPAYYLAKLTAIAAITLRGRDSHAIVASPRSALGPRQPHKRGDIVEIPMAVTRRLRLPVIGTSLALAGRVGAPRLMRGCLGDAVISLELHGIDFLDRSDGLDDLAPHQWDMRRPLSTKLAAFAAALSTLRSAGYDFVPLDHIATTFA